MNSSKIRVSADGTFYCYSDDWSEHHQSMESTGLRGYNLFNPTKPGGKQLLYFKEYRPNVGVYPLPDYIGGIEAIEADRFETPYDLSYSEKFLQEYIKIHKK